MSNVAYQNSEWATPAPSVVIKTTENAGVHTQHVNVDVSALPTGAATQATLAAALVQLQAANAMCPAVYDYVALSYTGSNLTGVVFKTGGAGGTTVSTLTLAYSGSQLVSVTKT